MTQEGSPPADFVLLSRRAFARGRPRALTSNPSGGLPPQRSSQARRAIRAGGRASIDNARTNCPRPLPRRILGLCARGSFLAPLKLQKASFVARRPGPGPNPTSANVHEGEDNGIKCDPASEAPKHGTDNPPNPHPSTYLHRCLSSRSSGRPGASPWWGLGDATDDSRKHEQQQLRQRERCAQQQPPRRHQGEEGQDLQGRELRPLPCFEAEMREDFPLPPVRGCMLR